MHIDICLDGHYNCSISYLIMNQTDLPKAVCDWKQPYSMSGKFKLIYLCKTSLFLIQTRKEFIVLYDMCDCYLWLMATVRQLIFQIRSQFM